MDPISLNAFIRRLGGYAPLGDEEVLMLASASNLPRKVAAHSDLIREGDTPGPVFVVLDGWVCRYKILADGSRQIMAFMMPGDFCDLHIGSLEEMDHSVGTLTSCHIASISRETMETLIVATPRLTQAFWRAQLVDQAILRAWIVSMGRREALASVAHLVLELYVRLRNIGLTSGGSFVLPLTQIVLSDALGITPVHTNRVLRTLREARVMNFASKTVTILDPPRLAALAGFDDNYLHKRIKLAA